MSFQCKLQFNESRDNARYKVLTDLLTIEGELREECTIVNPVITFAHSDVLPSLNYCTVPVFGRAYFVRELTMIRTGLYKMSLHCDVLASAGTALNQCSGIVRRQEYYQNYNLYLDDGVFKSYSDPIIVTKSFPSGFSGLSFALAVAGS